MHVHWNTSLLVGLSDTQKFVIAICKFYGLGVKSIHFMTSYTPCCFIVCAYRCTSSTSMYIASFNRSASGAWRCGPMTRTANVAAPTSLTPRTNHWLYARDTDAAPACLCWLHRTAHPWMQISARISTTAPQDIAIRQSSARETKAPPFILHPSFPQTNLCPTNIVRILHHFCIRSEALRSYNTDHQTLADNVTPSVITPCLGGQVSGLAGCGCSPTGFLALCSACE